jgi:hypothetical protein
LKPYTLSTNHILTAEQARKEAKSILGRIAHGDNPIAEKKIQKIKGMTLSNDVTAGYIMLDVERLRKPMQQITDFLIKQMNNVV